MEHQLADNDDVWLRSLHVTAKEAWKFHDLYLFGVSSTTIVDYWLSYYIKLFQ